jgi:excinuclease ABC subunit C
VEVVLTASEKEALLLENSLIKSLFPRFNILLRDDKDYLCLRLDLDHRWPKLELVRRPKKDGAVYFGPYHSASSARETLKLARRHFLIRSCKDRQMANRVRPCLQHQMHRCLGPCVLEVNREEYMRQVEYMRMFLLGKKEELVDELKERMSEAAQNFEYERAAALRDQIAAVEQTLMSQQVVKPGGADWDVLGLHRQGDQVQIVILEVREGRLKERLGFHFSGQEFPSEEILSSFVVQRYSVKEAIPAEILVSKPLEGIAALCEIMSERRGRKVRVAHPKRGARARQAAMADMNAEQMLRSRLKEADSIQERLTAVQRRLHLQSIPSRIECVDISHLTGKDTVGAMSVAVDGRVNTSLARIYKIRMPAEGDDYAAMTEVLTRRFVRVREKEKGWQAPDLLVVDGGKGQLNIAQAVLKELGLESQPVVAIAKERRDDKAKASDRIYIPGRKNPIPIKAKVSGLFIIAAVRDEAHRVAVSFQRKTRKKKALGSELDNIPGVGPKTRKALLKNFKSVKRIKEASIEELSAVPGVGPALAKKIKKSLGSYS